MNRIVYLPIEIKARDFHNKLLLTYFLTFKGFQVFLGRKKEIEILAKNFFPGIYFGVNTHKIYIKFYNQIKAKKHKLFLFDEEGLVTLPKKSYASTKGSREMINLSDFYFCWGHKQVNKILCQKNITKKKLVLSGSLRIELLKNKYNNLFKTNVDSLKKRYKKIILFISSYGNSNHYLSDKNGLKKTINSQSLKKKDDIKNYKYYYNFNKDRFKKFLNYIKDLKNKKSTTIVIRPHPSENFKFYKKIANDKNLLISSEFSVVEWIKASKKIIHDYCTTSFEASVLKKKIFHLPFKLENFKLEKDVYRLSNKIGLQVKHQNNKNKKNILKHHIHNYGNISSIDIICKVFDRLKMENEYTANFFTILRSKFFLEYYSLKKDSYADLKTPFIKKNECDEFLKKIEKIEKKKNKIKITQFAKNIMLIKSN